MLPIPRDIVACYMLSSLGDRHRLVQVYVDDAYRLHSSFMIFKLYLYRYKWLSTANNRWILRNNQSRENHMDVLFGGGRGHVNLRSFLYKGISAPLCDRLNQHN